MKTTLYLFFTFLLLTMTVSAQQYHTLLMQEWEANAWKNSTRSTNTYDANGNLTTTTMETWINGGWQNSALMTNTLNADGTVKETMTQTWENGNWQDAVMKIAYTYNSAKKVLTATTQMGTGDLWMDFNKISYTYNDQNQLINQVTQTFSQQSMGLVNFDQSTYSYNNDGTENQVITQNWNTSNQWENAARFTNTYNDAKKVTSDLNEKWENNAWVNDSKTTYTLNAAGFVQESLEQTWENNAWVSSFKDAFSYNGNNEITEILIQRWNKLLSQWDNDSRLIYNYGTTGIHPVDLSEPSLEVFPNPFTDQITIQSQLKDLYDIEVFNMSGQLIYSVKTDKNSYKLDLGTLGKGVYLIKTPQNNQSTKVIKTR